MSVEETPGRRPALLEVKGLTKHFPIKKGVLRKIRGQVRAVDDVSFTIFEGETLGLVGESGCGKTTTARCIMRALDPSDGELLFRTEAGATVDIATLPEAEMRPLRREIQMIFQDPYGSLNPRMNILDILGESMLVIGGITSRQERTERVAEIRHKISPTQAVAAIRLNLNRRLYRYSLNIMFGDKTIINK